MFKAPFVFEAKEEFKSLKKETILSISIAVASLMVIILFSGKFIYKYDAEWNKVLSPDLILFLEQQKNI